MFSSSSSHRRSSMVKSSILTQQQPQQPKSNQQQQHQQQQPQAQQPPPLQKQPLQKNPQKQLRQKSPQPKSPQQKSPQQKSPQQKQQQEKPGRLQRLIRNSIATIRRSSIADREAIRTNDNNANKTNKSYLNDDDRSYVHIVQPPALESLESSASSSNELVTYPTYPTYPTYASPPRNAKNEATYTSNSSSTTNSNNTSSANNSDNTHDTSTSNRSGRSLEKSKDVAPESAANQRNNSTTMVAMVAPPLKYNISTDTMSKISIPPPLQLLASSSSLTVGTSASFLMKRSTLSQYQSTPITKHYELSNQILAAFESTYYVNQLYVTAYCVGLQFVETALLEIPKHGYYRCSRHACERLQSTLDAARVAHVLDEMLTQAMSMKGESTTGRPLMNAARQSSLDFSITNFDAPGPESMEAAALVGDLERIRKLHAIALQRIEDMSLQQDRSSTKPESTDSASKNNTNESNGTVPFTTLSTNISSSSNISTTSIIPPPPKLLQLPPIRNPDDLAAHTNARDEVIEHNRGNGITGSGWVVCDFIADGTACSDAVAMCGGRNSASASATSSMPTSSFTYGGSLIPSPPTKPYTLTNQQKFQQNSTRTERLQSTTPDTNRQDSQSFTSFVNSAAPPLLRTSTSSSFNRQLAKALFLSGLEVSHLDVDHDRVEGSTSIVKLSMIDQGSEHSDSYDGFSNKDCSLNESFVFPSASLQKQQQQMAPRIQQQTLANIYHDDFFGLLESGNIDIHLAKTYQGRNPKSTNGCAVIAPLICIHHLLYHDTDSQNSQNNDSSINGFANNYDFLSDQEIIQVIDIETPVVVANIRQELGLADNAFLIPSDVHDYLLQQGQLCQAQFLTVTGGNILNDDHLSAFLQELENATAKQKPGESAKRVAATFFFHEHVISILKVILKSSSSSSGNEIVDSNSESSQQQTYKYCYELIDSLPMRATLRRAEETDEDMFSRFGIKFEDNNNNGGTQNASFIGSARSSSDISDLFSSRTLDDGTQKSCAYDFNAADGGDTAVAMLISAYEHHQQQSQSSHNFMRSSSTCSIALVGGGGGNDAIVPRTSRIRCSDSETLAAVLRWYACSVFTEENISYINQYQWDDAACDFDPRVFQAFVWSS